ncbi:hypothetical protein MOC74_06080 [Bacillus haynesii]|nr:hypothetical protein [Bacillus haynesii]MCY8345038.1 hypothetical protein [Bacillus haynesii]
MKLNKIVQQLKGCGFECEAGPLENNVAYIQLEKFADALADALDILNQSR